MKKQAPACLLALLLCLSMMPLPAFAEADSPFEESAPPAAEVIDGSAIVDEDGERSGNSGLCSDGVMALGADGVSGGADSRFTEVSSDGAEMVEVEEGSTIEIDEKKGEGDEPEVDAPVAPDLGFVYIDEAELTAGGTQNVAFALSDDGVILEKATLKLFSLSGEKSVEASEYNRGAALFEIADLESGEYELLSVDYIVAGCDEVFTESLEEGAYSFEVREVSSREPVEVAALSLNEQGELVEDSSTQEVIEEAIEAPSSTRMAGALSATSRAASSYPGIVVALDPGHGGSDSGATGNGLLEKNLTLSIAKYCQAALQRNGVSVFMTRSTDVYVGLSERVQKAAAAGASVFVSLHINSATPAAYGCEVWVPNSSSYKHDVYVAGKALGEKVIAKLEDLGLYNRGVKHRDSENGSKYPDGSVADYYSVINGARQQGIPGIIVEHAFISNSGDALKMQSDAFLKKLGEADAQGIIEAINSGVIKGGGQLYNDGKGYRYRTDGGADLKNDWVTASGHRYYMGSDGYAVRWEQKIDGYWYYFNGQSQMQKGWVTWKADGTKSYFDASGRALPGWQTLSGKRYYFSPSTGRSLRWEQKIDGYWYYFNGQSQMQKGWVTWKADGTKSYFDASGRALTGWQTLSGKRYYFSPSTGRSLRWEQKIDGYWYYFNGQSQMQKGWVTWKADGTKSYFDASGRALTGWQTLSGKRYYFSPSTGRSLRWEQKIDGYWYYFNGQSVMQTGWITWNADGRKSYFDPGKNGAKVFGEVSINGVPYVFDESGKLVKDYSYTIMGKPTVAAAQMARYYRATVGEATYPAALYALKGAKSIDVFCSILYDEAAAEGVRPDVLFGQIMHETGWLRFGGGVKAEQCNFGGLGAVSSTVGGATFSNVREGLRAQVQHLKAYGSKDALKNPCVDPRFHLVTRGIAPQVIDLNGRWAVPGNGYGQSIIDIVERLKKA
ncbi:N-acetylmuramoyl-L-alanine amidase [Adlercreutzia shanghongiae]|uniref:N-acetylmuramoyl-L-alanine amidase n=1 Tax=Adlercreutzia shanghongiae TaxID=3111773 RepID=A0ABU6J0B7_9ACTN|nr:N-acetylmuramoyl-L-alanine amidase [Adlercreutzia sp. R22]MEC4295530.1 N-acetylmuramoyl-L-alanine amidase [Adlercreutzia sp. R22]